MHALSDIEFHNSLKRIIEVQVLITNCVLTFSKCVFSRWSILAHFAPGGPSYVNN